MPTQAIIEFPLSPSGGETIKARCSVDTRNKLVSVNLNACERVMVGDQVRVEGYYLGQVVESTEPDLNGDYTLKIDPSRRIK